MACRVKKITKSPINKKDMSKLMDALTGNAEPDEFIVSEKYIKSLSIINKITTNLTLFSTFIAYSKYDFFDLLKKEIKDYLNTTASFIPTKLLTEQDIDNLPTETLLKNWKDLKDSKLVKDLIVNCKKLEDNIPNIQNMEENLKNNTFDLYCINKIPGMYYPFSFSTLELKKMWHNPNTNDNDRKYMMYVINTFYKNVKELYKILVSPDFDISDYSESIITWISALKDHPQLKDCKNAIKRIESSIDLLQSNFSSYYEECVKTSNPAIILESFTLDVANNTTNINAGLTKEFRKLIIFLKSKAVNSSKNEEVKKHFNSINLLFNLMKDPESGEKESNESSDSEDLDKIDQELNEQLGISNNPDISDITDQNTIQTILSKFTPQSPSL